MLARKLSALNPKHASDRAAAELDSTESNVVAVHAFWDEEARMLAMQAGMGTRMHACGMVPTSSSICDLEGETTAGSHWG